MVTAASVIAHLLSVVTTFNAPSLHSWWQGLIGTPTRAVRAIQVIHTPELVTRYEAARAEMTRRGIGFTERIMFHGTTDAARETICREGFMHKRCVAPGTWNCACVAHVA